MPTHTHPKRVLVTGATGQQGGAVAATLLDQGHHVQALVRRPDAAPAQALKTRGAELIQGDFDDTAALERAARGVDAVFAMATPFGGGEETEIRHGRALVDVARKMGVAHLVYSSVASADQSTGVPHFESKRRVEEHLLSLDLPATIVAPVFFSENLLAPWLLPALRGGQLPLAVPSHRLLQYIDVGTIARFVAWVIDHRDSFIGRRIDIAADERTGPEVAAILSGLSDKTIGYVEVPVTALKEQGEDLMRMFDWLGKVGYRADVAGLRRDYPEVGWPRLQDWLAERKTLLFG